MMKHLQRQCSPTPKNETFFDILPRYKHTTCFGGKLDRVVNRTFICCVFDGSVWVKLCQVLFRLYSPQSTDTTYTLCNVNKS